MFRVWNLSVNIEFALKTATATFAETLQKPSTFYTAYSRKPKLHDFVHYVIYAVGQP
jgi:hypothetical protein